MVDGIGYNQWRSKLDDLVPLCKFQLIILYSLFIKISTRHYSFL